MADLTDQSVIVQLEVEAAASVSFPTTSTDWGDVARAMKSYHEGLRDLMAVELATTPGEAQQAVYDAQVEKVAEMERFLSTTGHSFTTSLIWAT